MMLLISTTHTHAFHLLARAEAEVVPGTLPLPPDIALTVVATSSLVHKEKSLVRDVRHDDSSARDDLDSPMRVIIPSIKLDTMVVGVGLDAKGEMDVPSGKTKNVGWYKDGTIPGEIGSAVIDAHVFAAFDRLRELKEGADVYVVETSGSKLHFQVTYRKVYPLRDVPLNKLFLTQDARRLNLITCAGSLTRDHSTYDHRLIVYTTLVEDVNK